TWSRINQEMDTRFAHLKIVGWYHSHPDFGIFLSDRDLFIQQHFFSGPGQLALVVDPVREAEGVFIWQEGKPVLASVYWVGDRPLSRDLAARPAKEPYAIDTSGQADGTGKSAGTAWWGPLLPLLALLAAFLLGWLISMRVEAGDRDRIRREAIAEAALLLGIR